VHYLILIPYFKYWHFSKCWKHKDTARFKQVQLFVTVLLVSAGDEQADCTVYGDRGVVMTVTVTQHCYCLSNCSSWFIPYWKLDNYWVGNWQYGTNFCCLFVSLGRNMLEEMRKKRDYWLGIGTTNILKPSVELIVASVTCTGTCLALIRATFCRLLTTVEQTNTQTCYTAV